MRRTVSLLVGLVLTGGLAGCASSEAVPRGPYAISERALFEHLDRLGTSAVDSAAAARVDSAAAARQAGYAARQMRAAGLMPVQASSFFLRPGARDVLGYVPGRHPSHADTLVVVVADLEGAAAAAVLETARRLALEALDTQVPNRSLLFALWDPARDQRSGLSGYLAHPTWGLDRVARVVLVTAEAAAAVRDEALLGTYGVASEVVEVPPMGDGVAAREMLRAGSRALAETLYLRVRSLSMATPPAPPLALDTPMR